jgi:CubicO group peptidase (beta-lactamase class C family)
MQPRSLLPFVLSFSLVLSAAVSEGDYGLVSAETDSYISDLIQRYNSTGLSVAVIRQDPEDGQWNTEFRTYGVANENGDAPTPDTLFSIASNSKLFTTLSVGLLMNNESLSTPLTWTSKAKDVYGDLWKLWDSEAQEGVKIQDMFSHRSGLPSHDLSHLNRAGGVKDTVCLSFI